MAMNSKKRLLDEFEQVSEIDRMSKRAKIHGVVQSLSPMQASSSGNTKYFCGEITDGKSNLRLVGFDTKQQQKLAEFHQKKDPVALLNCEIKPSKWGSQLEVLMRKDTELQKSPKKFNVASLVCNTSNEITLDQLQDLNSYQRVVATVKVVSTQEVKEVKSGLRKQDYIVGDATGAATVTLWENNIGALKVGASYKLSGMMVREFDGKKFLSMPKQDAEITSIPDIGAVMEEECAVAAGCYMEDAVIGVVLLDTYSSCCICKSNSK